MPCEHEDEFDYSGALERLDVARPSRTMALKPTEEAQWVTADVQARALVAIAKSLRRIESRLCEKGGGGTAAS